jgi:CheY-like chemotaxis protein
MNGFQSTIAIRERERAAGTGQRVRIVAMTARAMKSDREQCLAVGMDGYLSKPIDPAALFAVVEQGSDGASADATQAVASTHVRRPTFDEAGLRERVFGDQELMSDIMRLFLAHLPARVDAIGAALADRDGEALRAAAHALKGSAMNVSCPTLVEASHALERAGAESNMEMAAAWWPRLSREADAVTEVLRAHAVVNVSR